MLLTFGDTNIAIDVGPDFRQQMLRAKVSSLHAILLTHEHNDHIVGLDDVRPFNFRMGRNMPLYGTLPVLGEVKQRFGYIFEENPYPGAPMIEPVPIHRNEAFSACGIPFQPIEVMHGNWPVLGFRTGDFTYITDMKTISPGEMSKVRGSKVLVVNALHIDPHHSHLNLAEALHFIAEVGPERAYITHIGHQMGLHAAVSAMLPSHVELAYDGLVVDLG